MNERKEVVKEVLIPRKRVACFEAFTSEIGVWWPKNHTKSGGDSDIALELRTGGRFFENTADGDFVFGTVRELDAPAEIVLDWYLGSGPENPSEVTIVFIEKDDATLVRVTHRGFEKIGDIWWERISLFDKGWTDGLQSFTAFSQGATAS